MWPPLFCKSFPKFVGEIHTPAAWDAPPLRLPGHHFPVIIFSHGLGGCRTTYTTFAWSWLREDSWWLLLNTGENPIW
ncbi:1-alkyl-2-acetylglycerophosphocholine esterase [Caerostris darwini]|uniref:1-alkyl-2-acetylglycerophosphocholine esterase n=1 Tax=Caerostris darwini TaxID=1538125 RepID=A0AAV4QIM0_9ARAC|nr:1-alkyl-2-acetylglycerophosphocholine esterase [Caerostris darwini]